MNIGLGQIIIIAIIVLLLWGNLPQLIKNVSKSLNDVFKMFTDKSEQNKKETHDNKANEKD
jgi:Sec-independent protein translocase protein TatA